MGHNYGGWFIDSTIPQQLVNKILIKLDIKSYFFLLKMSNYETIPSAPSGTNVSDDILVLDNKKSKSSIKKEFPTKRKLMFKKKPPPPLNPPKSLLKKHYFTKSDHVINKTVNTVKTKTSPFSYPKDLEIFAEAIKTKAWRKSELVDELKKNCSQKCSYRDKQRTDLGNRLRVDDADINTMKTIMDADPDYYKIITGRPISDPLNRTEYVESLRQTLRMKLIIGYKQDEIMSINENLYLEKELLKEVSDNFQAYVETFEDFLKRDHEESMKILHEAEVEEKLLQEKTDEFKELAKEYASLRSIVYKLEEKWRYSKTYQKFLYLVSPMSWREEFDTINSPAIHSICEVTNIFNKYNVETQVTDSLDSLLIEFQEDIDLKREPLLYFTDPSQLHEVFKFLEMQNLNALLHIEELAEPISVITEGMRVAEKSFDNEIHSLQETIDKLEGHIL